MYWFIGVHQHCNYFNGFWHYKEVKKHRFNGLAVLHASEALPACPLQNDCARNEALWEKLLLASCVISDTRYLYYSCHFSYFLASVISIFIICVRECIHSSPIVAPAEAKTIDIPFTTFNKISLGNTYIHKSDSSLETNSIRCSYCTLSNTSYISVRKSIIPIPQPLARPPIGVHCIGCVHQSHKKDLYTRD